MGRGVTGETLAAMQRKGTRNPATSAAWKSGTPEATAGGFAGKAPVQERSGRKSDRSDLVCTVRKAHKGRHRYGPSAGGLAQREEWFNCPACSDQAFRIVHATVYVELCDECQKNDPPAATHQATAGGSGVQTAPSYPFAWAKPRRKLRC